MSPQRETASCAGTPWEAEERHVLEVALGALQQDRLPLSFMKVKL